MNIVMNDETLRLKNPPDSAKQQISPPISAQISRSVIQIPLLKIPGTYRPPIQSNLDLMPQSARLPGYAGHLPRLISEPLHGRSFAYLTAYREALVSQRDRVWTTEYRDRHQASLLYKKNSDGSHRTQIDDAPQKIMIKKQQSPPVDSLTFDDAAPTPEGPDSGRSTLGPPSRERTGPRAPDLYAVELDQQAAALSGAGRIPGYAGHEHGLISSGLVGRTYGFLTRHRQELIHSHRSAESPAAGS
jgi:hypothetical protein